MLRLPDSHIVGSVVLVEVGYDGIGMLGYLDVFCSMYRDFHSVRFCNLRLCIWGIIIYKTTISRLSLLFAVTCLCQDHDSLGNEQHESANILNSLPFQSNWHCSPQPLKNGNRLLSRCLLFLHIKSTLIAYVPFGSYKLEDCAVSCAKEELRLVCTTEETSLVRCGTVDRQVFI